MQAAITHGGGLRCYRPGVCNDGRVVMIPGPTPTQSDTRQRLTEVPHSSRPAVWPAASCSSLPADPLIDFRACTLDQVPVLLFRKMCHEMQVLPQPQVAPSMTFEEVAAH